MTTDAALSFIIALRGGHPKCCDFCGKPYNKRRLPVPEEAGEWACTDCDRLWREQET